MSYHLPVIVSDIPANLEVGLKEECYFPCGNVEALAQKLQCNVSAPYHIENYDMSKYDWDAIAKQVNEVYRSLT